MRVLGLILAFICFTTSVNAQKGYELTVQKRMINGVDSTVFCLEVDRALEKDVSKAWRKLVEQKGKIKSVTKGDMTMIQGIVIERIDPDPLDIYATVVQQDTSVKVYSVFIVDGKRVDPEGVEGASVKVRMLLADFGAEAHKEVLYRELEEKETKLEELIKARDKNLKAEDDIDKSIQKDSLRIGTEETEIGLLKGQLQSATDRYTAQKSRLASTTFSDKSVEKEEKAKLKDIDKERKDIEKEIEKRSDKILDLKSEIREYWYQLKQLKADLEKIEQDIMNQRVSVQDAERAIEKLN